MSSNLINSNAATIPLSSIDRLQGFNLSAEYHVNKMKGKKPYIYVSGYFKEAKAGEITKAMYFTEIEVAELNELQKQMEELQGKIDKIRKK